MDLKLLILNENENPSLFTNLIEVMVWQFFKVKLKEGFVGICTGFLPQYFTKAILDGL